MSQGLALCTQELSSLGSAVALAESDAFDNLRALVGARCRSLNLVLPASCPRCAQPLLSEDGQVILLTRVASYTVASIADVDMFIRTQKFLASMHIVIGIRTCYMLTHCC